jgi:hypothetical protein
VVTAIKGTVAPKLDGVADDEIWKQAPEAKFTAIKGVNFKDGAGTTSGSLRAAYVGDTVYFLLTYDDPTQSARRSPFVKGADGKWTKLNDPNDKGRRQQHILRRQIRADVERRRLHLRIQSEAQLSGGLSRR